MIKFNCQDEAYLKNLLTEKLFAPSIGKQIKLFQNYVRQDNHNENGTFMLPRR